MKPSVLMCIGIVMEFCGISATLGIGPALVITGIPVCIAGFATWMADND